MKKSALFLSLIIISFFSGCAGKNANPVSSDQTQSITGKVTSARTGLPIAGAVITTTPATTTVTTDNTGCFVLPGISAGAYTVSSYEPGFKEKTEGDLKVSAGQILNVELRLAEINWSTSRSDNNATAAIKYSITPKINGASLTEGDIIGVFYDSLGTSACAGYAIWKSGENASVAIWGDDTQTPGKKEGFQINESIKWKIKRKADNIVFDASALYQTGQGLYIINGTYILEALQSK